ncbi:hypothetical protein [Stakelama tenebrarum]|uniref:Uncharacterized protein n=1 Tax=Stakelama tenebrarum TaxID=2711215 RepID=A0A6G6Y993_9SPHN|nr:hypothetical protein [Sphingosinithalassobacter tenebrarum]QIG81480.1 hypothetical protein G5C33_17940 [Sphingosinithalassobacter tenebrarum]
MRDDALTLGALAAGAACVAALAHEAVGHGTACLIEGGRVTLLTATFFGCEGGGVLTDMAGPFGGLTAGLVALLVQNRFRSAAWRYFCAMLAAFSLCWFAGGFVYSPLTGHGDHATVAYQLRAPDIWRVASLITGIVLYGLFQPLMVRGFRRIAAPDDPPGMLSRRVGVGQAAGAVGLGLAGFGYPDSLLLGALQGFLAIGLAAVPMWLAVASVARRRERQGISVARSRSWIVSMTALWIAFVAIQGTNLLGGG